jgi:hypothetical protein
MINPKEQKYNGKHVIKENNLGSSGESIKRESSTDNQAGNSDEQSF